MQCSNQGVFRQQARFLRHQFLQDGELPFSNVLSEDMIARALDSHHNMLAGSDLFAARYLVGLLGPSFECGPFVSRGGCPLDRPPGFAWASSVLFGDWRLLPGSESVCRKSFSRTWPVRPDVPWRRASIPSGCGNPAAFSSMTGRRFRCPIRRRISAIIRNPTRRSLAWAFPWRESQLSFLWPVVPFSTSGSAGTRVKGKASWGCCASCGTCFSPVTSCSPIA